MGSPLHEFKKQASFFLKEKIKTARLILTDVTPAELLTEEATNNGNLDTSIMGVISRAAFEVDDYWRIVEILHKRLSKFDRETWRASYNALVLLEHLLTHGPQRVAEEFASDKNVIEDMKNFQYFDDKGFNWGLSAKKLSERILRLIEDETFLKEEKARARKLTREIKGFGSFNQSSSIHGTFKDSFRPYGTCNSQYNADIGQQEIELLALNQAFTVEKGVHSELEKQVKDPKSWLKKSESSVNAIEEDHPFCNDHEHDATSSLLSN
ncbi:ENTH domain-containing protein [Cephalotus follicularis]|uniref:ENTH domain-containing protein n=1 Tax=Cephalotus follicularis TaxID=3775 RepID=A0A1Q3BLN1_CEPFO|nr:ENTH domain-containing protein [Cephalotus follicularis]